MVAADYSQLALAAVSATPILQRLKTTDAVVLERIARGGGDRRWYFCANEEQHLEQVVKAFRPGGLVSFYFDKRIGCALDTPKTRSIIENLLAQHGEMAVGLLNSDGFTIDMFLLDVPEHLDYFDFLFASTRSIFFGQFPANENDGFNAVTLILPDADGIVRGHPY